MWGYYSPTLHAKRERFVLYKPKRLVPLNQDTHSAKRTSASTHCHSLAPRSLVNTTEYTM